MKMGLYPKLAASILLVAIVGSLLTGDVCLLLPAIVAVAVVSHLGPGGAARRRPDHRGRPLGQVGICDRVRGDPHLLLLGSRSEPVRFHSRRA